MDALVNKEKRVTILAIESSCDETSAAVCRDGKILSNYIANQTVHEKYGGVVPELASRAHMQNIVPVVEVALQQAGVTLEEISGIAFTQSPGLIGSLLVGSQFAKSISLALDIPLISVHHMQAHVLANLIPDHRPSFPFLCLTVSGGHTQIVLAKSPTQLEIIGETLDDAAGEAFDKSAKMLGLPYPGGPLIDAYAQLGDPTKFTFAEPKIEGLNLVQNRNDLCASIQKTIVSILIQKLQKASKATGITDICIAGGVSANSGLRSTLQESGITNGWNTFFPPFEYCTDNAAMIAITGYYKFLESDFAPLSVSASARGGW